MNPILTIKNLKAKIGDKQILNGINLEINPGEVHAIMGPNGSGKSTLAATLAGREDIEITDGALSLKGDNIQDWTPDARARAGMFLGFQYPVEIPGISTLHFLKTALNEQRTAAGVKPLDAVEFLETVKGIQQRFNLSDEMLKRPVNEGFSGGEKKKNEMFQMAVLEPSLAILDETDSGLDVDALKTISNGINALRSDKNAMIVITHYQRILDHITPDVVHIMQNGVITKSGGMELVHEIEQHGYGKS